MQIQTGQSLINSLPGDTPLHWHFVHWHFLQMRQALNWDKYYGFYRCTYRHDSMREKFACFDCRRVFKLALVAGNEYMSSRPVQVRSMWTPTGSPRTPNKYMVYAQPSKDQSAPSIVEPGWKPLGRGPRWCCGECGKEGTKVGTAFEAPPRHDKLAWDELRKWVENGGEQKERANKIHEVAEEGCVRGYARHWFFERQREKQRRLEALQQAVKLGVRTADEEAKLAVIRARKENLGKHDGDAVSS